jgi:hypothetical protein
MNATKRVKVYKLNEGVWIDQGTGYLEFEMESQGIPEMVVKAEESERCDSKYILRSQVDKGDVYLKYQGI